MRVTVLGCGGSEGVPSSLGDWGRCDPLDPRNRRRRPGILVETTVADGTQRTILIDTPPELREQLAPLKLGRLDGVLLTHSHADHLHGLDDLRPIARRIGAPIPIYAEQEAIDDLRRRFAYAVLDGAGGVYRPIVSSYSITGPFALAGIDIVPMPLDHGFGPCTGYRIGKLGYTIDVVRLSDAAFAALEGIELWIVDCQQIEPHPSHSHLDQTLGWIRRVKPRRAVLTHLGPRLDYTTLAAMLPTGVEPGVDGLVLDI